MKIFYYNSEPNFGDMLNKYIWPHYLKPLLEQDDNTTLLGIGTIIGINPGPSEKYIVCGSGCGYVADLNILKKNNYIFEFVRGPLTAAVLGLHESKWITDPAILTPLIFPAAPATGRTVFIPHHVTAASPLWRKVCEMSNIDYIDPLDDVSKVVAQISGAKLVITEAMHGAILADAYRIPWISVRTSPHINIFKWTDWLKTHDLDVRITDIPFLGFCNFFRSMTHSSITEKVFLDHLANKCPSYANLILDQHYPSNILNKIYSCLPSFKNRLSRFLCNKGGLYADHALLKYRSTMLVQYHLEKVSKALIKLKNCQGFLSSDHIMKERQNMVLEKLADIKGRYLLPPR